VVGAARVKRFVQLLEPTQEHTRIALPVMGLRPRPARPTGRTRPAEAHDAHLVGRARDGERAAFEELVRRHADPLFAIIVRYGAPRAEAEEITQEAFVRAWRSLGSFKGEAEFFTWLYRIGINEAKRHMARRSTRLRRVADDDGPLEAIADRSQAPDRAAEHEDLRAALAEAVRELPEKYRVALVLRDIEGLSTAQAAAVVQIGEPAFKSRLHRARLAVRAALEGHLDGGSGA